MNSGLLRGPARGRIIGPLGFPLGMDYAVPQYPIPSPAAHTVSGIATTTQSINLPLYSRIGDILVGLVGCDGAPTAITYPDASWVQMNSYSAQTAIYFYRICDGTDLDRATSFDLTLTVARRVSGLVWRIRGAEPQAPVFSSLNNNTSTPMDPPGVTWATAPDPERAALVMWLSRLGNELPGFPAGYTTPECALCVPDDRSSYPSVAGGYAAVFGRSENPPGNSGGNASSFGVMTCAFLAKRDTAIYP